MTQPLSLPGDEMRRLGHRVVDRIVDHLEELDRLPPIRVGDARELRAAVGGPAPEEPGDPDRALDVLFDSVLPFSQYGDHPRFFARIGSPSNYLSVLADTLAAGFNLFNGSWTGGSGAAVVELTVVDWLRQICGLPAGTEGVLVTGGSVGTLTALGAARTARLDGRPDPAAVTYLSDQAHATVHRGLAVLGFAPEQVRTLPSEGGRLPVDAVAAAVAEDRAAGRRPFCVAATAGTTSTGAVDPLAELADLCAAEDLWLHVDGAYGAPAALTPAGRELLDGLERADSVVLDPHKWLFQPYEVGCALVRWPGLLEETFTMDGAYLRDTQTGQVDLRNRSVQLTRGARALKLWLSVQVFGLAAFRAAVERGIALAEHAERLLRERDGWEVVSPAQLGIVCFRRIPGDDALQTRLAAATVADGFAAPSTTEVDGRVALRFCTINPRTTEADVEATLDRMESLEA